MIFYLQDGHVKIRCDHASLCKLVYSMTKDDKVNNWSQEIHVIAPYTDFEHIKEKTISWQTAFQDQRL